MVTFPQFGRYVSDGDHVEVEHEGFVLRATVHQDIHMGAPWEEHDGHGPVSAWTFRDKRPGERVLCRDRGSKRFYDVAAAIRLAKRDGWGPRIPYRTPGIAAAIAVEQDYRVLKAWCDDEWCWCGVAVTVFKAGVQLTGKYDAALWGIEMNYPDSDNSYLSEVASELADEALEQARAKLSTLIVQLAA